MAGIRPENQLVQVPACRSQQDARAGHGPHVDPSLIHRTDFVSAMQTPTTLAGNAMASIDGWFDKRRWSNCAATGPGQHWSTNVCNAPPLGKSC